MLLRVPTPVAPDETGGELSARLAELGALALVEALTLIASGAAAPEPQDHAQATHAPKITRELARIHWSDPAERIARVVRALDPRPGAWTTLAGHEVKLFGPQPAGALADTRHGTPGTAVETDPALVVATGEGGLQFLDVQPAGRTRMAMHAWVRGRGVEKGQRFE